MLESRPSKPAPRASSARRRCSFSVSRWRGDLVLHGEHVRHLAVVALGPEVVAVSTLMSCAVTRSAIAALRTLPSSTVAT